MSVTNEVKAVLGQETKAVIGGELNMAGLSVILFGAAAFQYLNAASDLGLLDYLAEHGPSSKPQLAKALTLEDRAIDILLLGVTSLGITYFDGEVYRLGSTMQDVVTGADWKRFKDVVAFEQYVVYQGQFDFTESLRQNTNVGLRRVPGTGRDLYHRFTENPSIERVFYEYMASWSELANGHLVESLDLSNAVRLLDVGGGDGVNSIALAEANPNLEISVFEIPASAPITQAHLEKAGVADRVSVIAGDFFQDPFPADFDVIMFAHQLVIWTLEENTALLRKAYDALAPGGRIVIFNSMSNDTGDGPVVAALDSVYFAALPAEGGMIYSWKQHEQCLQEAGFRDVQRVNMQGWTPHGMLIGVK